LHLADSSAALRDIGEDITSVEAPGNADTIDVSGFGDTKKKYVVGLQDSQMRIQGNFNDVANKAHAVFSGIVGGTTGLKMHFWPRGSATGAPQFRGSVLCSEYSVTSSVTGAVTFSANLVPFDTNPPTWGTA